MEKRKNSFYKACSIICYIQAAIALSLIFVPFIFVLTSTALTVGLSSEVQTATVDNTEYAAEAYASMGFATIVLMLILLTACIACVAVTFVLASKFKKMTYMTNEEAYKNWKSALAWVIISYFFSGYLVGGLATGGLCSIHRSQKNQYMKNSDENVVAKVQSLDEPRVEVESDQYSSENLEKVIEQLEKLNKLKEINAISEEEYEKLRDQILGKETQKEEEKVEEVIEEPDITKEYLERLEKLRESNAVSEEEYENLKTKILENKK